MYLSGEGKGCTNVCINLYEKTSSAFSTEPINAVNETWGTCKLINGKKRKETKRKKTKRKKGRKVTKRNEKKKRNAKNENKIVRKETKQKKKKRKEN